MTPVKIFIILAIASMLLAQEARYIKGRPQHKDVCGNPEEICKWNEPNWGWCSPGFDHDCCFWEKEPVEGLANCREFAKCYYMCCPIGTKVCPTGCCKTTEAESV